jgi:hypothetical protein
MITDDRKTGIRLDESQDRILIMSRETIKNSRELPISRGQGRGFLPCNVLFFFR